MQPLAVTACAYGFNIPLTTVFQQFTIKSFVCSEAFWGTCHCHLIKPLTFPSKAARKPIFSQPIVMYWQSDLMRIPTNRSHSKRNHHPRLKNKLHNIWKIVLDEYSIEVAPVLARTWLESVKVIFLLCGEKKVLKSPSSISVPAGGKYCVISISTKPQSSWKFKWGWWHTRELQSGRTHCDFSANFVENDCRSFSSVAPFSQFV